MEVWLLTVSPSSKCSSSFAPARDCDAFFLRTSRRAAPASSRSLSTTASGAAPTPGADKGETCSSGERAGAGRAGVTNEAGAGEVADEEEGDSAERKKGGADGEALDRGIIGGWQPVTKGEEGATKERQKGGGGRKEDGKRADSQKGKRGTRGKKTRKLESRLTSAREICHFADGEFGKRKPCFAG